MENKSLAERIKDEFRKHPRTCKTLLVVGFGVGVVVGYCNVKKEKSQPTTPECSYQTLACHLPLTFEYNEQAIAAPPITHSGKRWINIDYPLYQATLYGSYHNCDTLPELLHQSEKFVARQGARASQITALQIDYPQREVYATLYRIAGSGVASPLQVVVTDSLTQLFRGSLYFDQGATTDAQQPTLDHLESEIKHLVESFKWEAKDATR